MMNRDRALLFLATLAVAGLVACDDGKGKGGEPTGSAKPAATTAKSAAPKKSAEPAKSAAPKDDAAGMTATELNKGYEADKAKWEGKEVAVKGFYMGMTKQGDQVNVSVYTEASIDADSVLCVFPADVAAKLDKKMQKEPIAVKGTVDGLFFKKVKLKDCKLAD